MSISTLHKGDYDDDDDDDDDDNNNNYYYYYYYYYFHLRIQKQHAIILI